MKYILMIFVFINFGSLFADYEATIGFQAGYLNTARNYQNSTESLYQNVPALGLGLISFSGSEKFIFPFFFGVYFPIGLLTSENNSTLHNSLSLYDTKFVMDFFLGVGYLLKSKDNRFVISMGPHGNWMVFSGLDMTGIGGATIGPGLNISMCTKTSKKSEFNMSFSLAYDLFAVGDESEARVKSYKGGLTLGANIGFDWVLQFTNNPNF
jgi:hypothetical protein